MNYDDVIFYRTLKMGMSKPLKDYSKLMITYAYGLTMDGRAFMEDVEGGFRINQINYIKTLKWRILDLLGEMEAVLAGSEVSDSIHYSSQVLEYGIAEIANISGKELINIFDLNDQIEDETVNVDGIVELWKKVLNEFPGDIPDPLTPQGHLTYMAGLKAWANCCEETGLSTDLVIKLLKEA